MAFGNYSFGIHEHIDIPGVKYEPQIGILGLGVSVALARPGYSIRKRSKHKASVGKAHAISAQEAKRLSSQRVWSDSGIMAKDRSYKFYWKKKSTIFGRGSRWCKRCGDYTAVIQKYDLMLCRRCFREVAVSPGIQEEQVSMDAGKRTSWQNLFVTLYNNETRRKRECTILPHIKTRRRGAKNAPKGRIHRGV